LFIKMKKTNAWFVVLLIIVSVVAEIIVSLSLSDNYVVVGLQDFNFKIPKKIWQEGKTYSSDHMLYLYDETKEYQIYGSLLNEYNYEDEELGFLSDETYVKKLLDGGYSTSIEKIILDHTDLLDDGAYPIQTSLHDSTHPRYDRYGFRGRGKGVFKDYNSVVFYYNESGRIFVEVILYKRSDYLSEKQIRDMFHSLRFDI